VTTPSTAPGASLARLGFERTQLAAASLDRLGAAPGSPLVDDLAAGADPDLAARVLADLVTAAADPAALAARLRAEAGFRRRLIAVTSASRSLGTWLVAHPDEVGPIADDDRFARPRTRAELLEEALATAGDPDADGLPAAWDHLRRFKRRELLRIAARDLLEGERPASHEERPVAAPAEQIGAELADLADACLAAGLRLALRTAGDPPLRMTLIGMGKLGGRELNYVSDVDVMAVHEPDEGADPERVTRAAGKAVQALAAGLGTASSEGLCYRVDLNLRPEGRDGPLSRRLESYVAYWDRWAEPWEFQALLKSRPVAGDAELGERFDAEAITRVYRERLEPDAIAAIRSMKARVESSVSERLLADRHVKLGPGGIRDIEWAVQLLQLVHARNDPGLRDRSTLGALDQLATAGLVGRRDAAALATAYRFLRTVEHRLQLADERQTHVLPESEAERRRLARVLGYRDGPEGSATDAFEADRRRSAATVRTLHEKLFYRPLLEVFGAVPALTAEQEDDRLVALGFAAPDRAVAHLRALTGGLSRSAGLMRAALPVLLPRIAAAPDPDAGLLALRTLAEKLRDRAAFLTMLRENPVGAERLCAVLGASPLIGELLGRHPELIDGFADPAGFAGRRDADDLRDEALKLVNRHAGLGEITGAWDALRRFRRRELVRIAVRDLLSAAEDDGATSPVGAVGMELSGLAEACLAAALSLAARAEGRPPVRIALIGMGKLGGRELNYPSDLDLLAVHEPEEGAEPQVAARAAGKVIQGLIKGLGWVTREGAVYAVDFDLRPEGKDGPLSRTLPGYTGYWARWADPWERQALTKARPVAGDPELGARFLAEAHRWVYADRLDQATLAELRKMKARVETERLPKGADPKLHLKLGPGGQADVEWTAQLMQLERGWNDPGLRDPGTRVALDNLVTAGALEAEERDWLADAYELSTRLRNFGYLVTGRPMDQLPTDQGVLARLASALGPEVQRQQLMEEYRRATRRARRVVERRFWGGRLDGDTNGD
jgi:glutamate-ammonia-ligase adenylyltransferase